MKLGERHPLNPVLARELRQRMRSRWTPLVLTLYLGLLVLVAQLVYGAAENNADRPFGPGILAAASVGRSVFHMLLFFVLVMLCFLVPGLAASAIAGERERQTLVPLQVTLLGPRHILAGKMGASLAFLVLLVVATLPLFGVALLVGGVSLWEILRGVAMVIAAGLTLASLSVAISTFVRRTQAATVLAYFVVLTMIVGTFIVYGMQGILLARQGADPQAAVLLLNPLVATADLVGETANFTGGASPFDGLKSMIDNDDGGDAVGQALVGPDGREIVVGAPAQARQPGDPLLPFWLKALVLWAGLSLGTLALAARRLRLPAPAGGQ
ncbi:MAG: ABC transporter permease [Acidimicrobiales bacterium]